MSVFAQDAIEPYLEYRKRIEMAQNIAPLEHGLFGEQVSLYNGSTTFSVTDIDIPGNNTLPVQLRREFAVELQPQNDIGEYDSLLRGVGNWDVEVPYMAASYNVSAGDALRCNGAYLPDISVGEGFRRGEVWQGISVHIPGRGNTVALGMQATTPRPSDGATYKLTTSERDVFRCIPMQAGFTGEGFRMTTAAGLRYYFDVATSRTAARLLKYTKTSGQTFLHPLYLDRNRLYLLASKIEDRFGNTVQFQYNSNGHPTRIWSNDGREIVLTYTGGRLSSATSHGRTWQYQYTNVGNGLYARLSTVTLPDASRWQYTYTSDLMPSPEPASLSPAPWCVSASLGLSEALTFTATHPSGAVGTFNFTNTRHFRSGVHASECMATGDPFDPSYDLLVPYYYDVMSIQSKVISGAGLPQPLSWSYAYAPHVQFLWGVHDTFLPYPCTTCSTEKVVTVTNPDDTKSRHHFGMRYHDNDGRLLEVETISAAGAVLRTETNTYLTEAAAATQPFTDEYGSNLGGTSDPASVRIRPVVNRTITQDGVNFVLQTNSFDTFARPKNETRSSTVLGNPARTEETSYHDDLALWVLGQVSKVLCKTPSTSSECTAAGIETFERTYDGYALPLTTERFGKADQVLTWDTSSSLASGQRGTAKSVADGAGHQTVLANYKRGTPQAITLPDSKTQSAVVDDWGQIVSLTDQAGSTTTYTYDPIGRLTGITYPTGDEQAWLPQTFAYAYVTSAENGVAAGHWRRTASQGNARTVSYFDALLRPVLETRFINGASGSNITRRSEYDWRGQTTFASYPVAGLPPLTSITAGTASTYDALGRLSKTEQTSELGTLTTSTAYLTGAVRQITDPKGNVTTTSYQMFDQPSYDAPVKIVAPAGLTQTITRGVYGRPLVINQSGVYGTESLSVNKTFVYDSYRRLCRSTEPESGSTVMDYDPADNLLWSASGLTITGTGCGREQVSAAARTTRTYDPMNRLLTVLPPAGTQSTAYTYDPLGNPKTAVSGISSWSATYNKRSMLIGESLQLVGQNAWAIGYAHDAYGHVSLVHYPDGEDVSYAPDALGRPTRVGNYATGIAYFPNGEPGQFLFGNGAVYLAEQNARQLLSNFTYGVGSTPQLSEDLAYDPNGNITSVADLAGGPRNKSLGYDALNRLTSATANGLWGTQAFTYDALNNLRTLQTNGQTAVYHYDTSNKLASISGATTVSYSYDPRGNVQTKNNMTLLFDQKNQLTQIVGVNTYAYDAAGRRVSKIPTTGSPAYYFYNQAGQLMHQVELGSARATNLIYLGRKLLAKNATISLGASATIGFSSNPNNGSYTVNWGAVPGATSYVLQESANGGTWTTVYSGSAPSAALSGRAGGSYVYRVEGCIGTTCGAFTTSATLGVTPTLPTVTVPTGIVNGAYTVSWTAPATATAYAVQERLGSGAWTTIASNTPATSISRPGTTSGSYTYQVAASNAHGTRGWAASGAVTVNTDYGVVPSPLPSYTVPATNATGSVTLSWSASAPVTQYTLQQSSNGGTSWSTAYAGLATSATLSGLADGSYTYRLQACNDTAGNSVCTAWVAGGPMVVTHPPTTAPALSAPASSSNGSYTVSWGSVGSATSYTLQEQTNGGSWSTIQSGTATSKAISGKGNGSYGYRAQGCNAGGCGPWSATKSATVLLPPPTPASISAPATSSGSIAVSWSSSATATSYTLQQRLGGGGWSSVYTGAATGSTRTVTASGSYTYQVQACNASGCSAYKASSAVTVTIPPASTPSLSAPVTSSTGSYTVSWGAVSGATSYTLQEQVNGGGWSTVQTGSATSKAFSGKGNASYGYRAQACNAGGCGAWSATDSVVVSLIPATPTGLTATLTVIDLSNPLSMTLDGGPLPPYTYRLHATWMASSGATSYNFKYCKSGATCSTLTVTTNEAWPLQISGSQYTVSVQACSAGGCSAYSAVVIPTVIYE